MKQRRFMFYNLVGLIFVISILLVATGQLLETKHMSHPTDVGLPVRSQTSTSSTVYEYNGVEIRWTGKGSFQLRKGNLVVYVDPMYIADPFSPYITNQTLGDFAPADIIVCTHTHHCSSSDIAKICDEEKTTIVTVQQCESLLFGIDAKEISFVRPNDTLEIGDITLEFVPAYDENIHPKRELLIGVIIDFGDARIYYAGDSNVIPEMSTFVTDVALLPICGFNGMMNALEAAEAVESLKISSNLHAAIPFHYGSVPQCATVSDALVFQSEADTTVIILEIYFGEVEPINSVSAPGFDWYVGIITLGILISLVNHRRMKNRRFR